ncbi:MAG: transposase [Candidatus Thermoplasmatota archaeon]|nr:transposase [Candidatus Thermoplasmatota archaeon]
MISIGIDTHEKMHYVEAQNERQQVMWHGSISNNREGFSNLMEKIHSLCRNNSQEVIGIFMNPTGNYHVPLKYFLEAHGYQISLVDARKTFHLRQIMNLGTEKSDREDAHVLAATPWMDRNAAGKAGHSRSALSEITRLRELVNRNIT